MSWLVWELQNHISSSYLFPEMDKYAKELKKKYEL